MYQNAVRLKFSLQTLLEPSTTVLILGLIFVGKRELLYGLTQLRSVITLIIIQFHLKTGALLS